MAEASNVTNLIQPFRVGETRDQRKAKIMRVNDLTEQVAKSLVEGEVGFAEMLIADLEAAGIVVDEDNPQLWQAEERD